MPCDTAMPASANRLHSGFLRGEASGVAFETVGLAVGVSYFPCRKDSFEETAAEAHDAGFDPWDFANVYAGTEDHFNLD